MDFDLISDFHSDLNNLLEPATYFPDYQRLKTPYVLYDWKRFQKSDTLVLAGDTANLVERAYYVYREAATVYDKVLFVHGNHECYLPKQRDVNTVVDLLDQCETDRIVHLRPNRSYLIGRTAFIGACGWYDFRASDLITRAQFHRTWRGPRFDPDQPTLKKLRSSDASEIRFNRYPDKLARDHAEYVRDEIGKYDQDDSVDDIVVITHVPPRPEFLWKYPTITLEDGSYVSRIMGEIGLEKNTNGKVKVWCFGHTHKDHDRVLDGIRYVCNPRGYHFNDGFRKKDEDTNAHRDGPKLINTQEKFDYSALFAGIPEST